MLQTTATAHTEASSCKSRSILWWKKYACQQLKCSIPSPTTVWPIVPSWTLPAPRGCSSDWSLCPCVERGRRSAGWLHLWDLVLLRAVPEAGRWYGSLSPRYIDAPWRFSSMPASKLVTMYIWSFLAPTNQEGNENYKIWRHEYWWILCLWDFFNFLLWHILHQLHFTTRRQTCALYAPISLSICILVFLVVAPFAWFSLWQLMPCS